MDKSPALKPLTSRLDLLMANTMTLTAPLSLSKLPAEPHLEAHRLSKPKLLEPIMRLETSYGSLHPGDVIWTSTAAAVKSWSRRPAEYAPPSELAFLSKLLGISTSCAPQPAGAALSLWSFHHAMFPPAWWTAFGHPRPKSPKPTSPNLNIP